MDFARGMIAPKRHQPFIKQKHLVATPARVALLKLPLRSSSFLQDRATLEVAVWSRLLWQPAPPTPARAKSARRYAPPKAQALFDLRLNFGKHYVHKLNSLRFRRKLGFFIGQFCFQLGGLRVEREPRRGGPGMDFLEHPDPDLGVNLGRLEFLVAKQLLEKRISTPPSRMSVAQRRPARRVPLTGRTFFQYHRH